MIKKMKSLAEDFSPGELLLALSILQNLQVQLRRPVASPKLLAEAALLKLVYLDGLKPVDTLIQNASSGSRIAPGIPVEKKTVKPADFINKAEIPQKGTGIVSPGTGSFSERKGACPPQKETEPVTNSSRREGAQEGLSLNDIERVWPQVIEFVKAKRMSLSLYLAEAEPAELDGTVIVLGLPSEFRFHKEMLEKETNKQFIEEAFAQALGQKVRIQCVVTEREGTTQETSGMASASKDEDVPDIVAKALEIFDGSKVIRKD